MRTSASGLPTESEKSWVVSSLEPPSHHGPSRPPGSVCLKLSHFREGGKSCPPALREPLAGGSAMMLAPSTHAACPPSFPALPQSPLLVWGLQLLINADPDLNSRKHQDNPVWVHP